MCRRSVAVDFVTIKAVLFLEEKLALKGWRWDESKSHVVLICVSELAYSLTDMLEDRAEQFRKPSAVGSFPGNPCGYKAYGAYHPQYNIGKLPEYLLA